MIRPVANEVDPDMLQNYVRPYAEVTVVEGGIADVRSATRGDTRMKDAMAAYLEAVGMLVSDVEDKLGFAHAVDQDLGGAGRTVLSPRHHHEPTRRIAEVCGIRDPLGVVIFGEDFIAGRSSSEVAIRDIAACDLGRIVAGDLSISGTGPVQKLLPWLTGFASSLVIYGEGEGYEDFVAETTSRFVHAMARSEYGRVNAMGKLETQHPDHGYIFETVAEEASARRCVSTPSLGEATARATQAVLSGLSSMGVPVNQG